MKKRLETQFSSVYQPYWRGLRRPRRRYGARPAASQTRTHVLEQNEERLCSEDNYKRRKPLPRLADLKTAETALMRMQRPGLKTFVVGAGVLYGNGEYLLHPLFKSAWLGESDALDVSFLQHLVQID